MIERIIKNMGSSYEVPKTLGLTDKVNKNGGAEHAMQISCKRLPRKLLLSIMNIYCISISQVEICPNFKLSSQSQKFPHSTQNITEKYANPCETFMQARRRLLQQKISAIDEAF